MQTSTTYPYTGTYDRCKYDATQGLFGTTGYVAVSYNNPVAIMTAVAKQPVNTAVSAGS